MKTNNSPAKPNKDGTFDAVFMASLIESVEPELSPATVNVNRFLSNPVLLYQHYSMPIIGCVTDIVKRGGKITGRIKFDEEDEFALTVRKKWESGMIRACSMGLAYRNDSWELLEVSIVSIPRDPAAVRNELDAMRLSLHDEGGEPNEKNDVEPTEPAPLRILAVQERENVNVKTDKKMSDTNTTAEPKATPEPKVTKPAVPEYHLTAEELKSAYVDLIPSEFAGDTPKAVLAEASKLNPETHSLEYMRAIADTRLSQRKEAKEVKHAPATQAQVHVTRKAYSLSEIHAMESRNKTRG